MYSNYLVLKKLLQPVGFALKKLLHPVCLLFRKNFVKYLIYMASLIMVGLSFGPFIVMRYHSWAGFRGKMISKEMGSSLLLTQKWGRPRNGVTEMGSSLLLTHVR